MKEQILATAMKLAGRKGFRNVTRDDIAADQEIATGSVSYHFGTMRKLQAAMVTESIEKENVTVFTQALVGRHPLALAAPQRLKDLAARALRG
jgi:AcrR family transcriptional regulator